MRGEVLLFCTGSVTEKNDVYIICPYRYPFFLPLREALELLSVLCQEAECSFLVARARRRTFLKG